MITLKKGPVRVGEVWFDEEPHDPADVFVYCQRSSPVTGALCSDFMTLLVDLTRSEENLLRSMQKGAQYKIRRAGQRDRLVYQGSRAPEGAAIRSFLGFYNAFAERKGLSRVKESLLQSYAGAGVLDLSVVKDEYGTPLVWHAHYRSTGRARLLYSASLYRESSDSGYRNMVGRANRFQHWQDMLRFKSEGATTYDLGGWYKGREDLEKLAINQFKEEFGGGLAKNFNCLRSVSLKGKLFLVVKGLLGR